MRAFMLVFLTESCALLFLMLSSCSHEAALPQAALPHALMRKSSAHDSPTKTSAHAGECPERVGPLR